MTKAKSLFNKHTPPLQSYFVFCFSCQLMKMMWSGNLASIKVNWIRIQQFWLKCESGIKLKISFDMFKMTSQISANWRFSHISGLNHKSLNNASKYVLFFSIPKPFSCSEILQFSRGSDFLGCDLFYIIRVFKEISLTKQLNKF